MTLQESDEEFAAALQEMWAAGEEAHSTKDGLYTRPSQRLARKRAKDSAAAALAAAEAKRARKAAKLRGQQK